MILIKFQIKKLINYAVTQNFRPKKILIKDQFSTQINTFLENKIGQKLKKTVSCNYNRMHLTNNIILKIWYPRTISK